MPRYEFNPDMDPNHRDLLEANLINMSRFTHDLESILLQLAVHRALTFDEIQQVVSCKHFKVNLKAQSSGRPCERQ